MAVIPTASSRGSDDPLLLYRCIMHAKFVFVAARAGGVATGRPRGDWRYKSIRYVPRCVRNGIEKYTIQIFCLFDI